ncbi:MAG: hypothetical protein IT306_20795 [Chloroflexi bacterium]|nr:hypothetical protein [Chloroflexota bacterium]
MIWSVRRSIVMALLTGGLLLGGPAAADASDRTAFRGCVETRTDTSITLSTSGNEHVTVDTTWIAPNTLNNVLVDCVTVTAVTVDGRYVAESIEAGDEQSEATADRQQRNRERDDRDDKGSQKND